MIYDVFPFFNELDLLELRLNELDGVVDKFVISESDISYSGRRKPLHYHENKRRFRKWWPKIIHQAIKGVVIDTTNPWDRESAYRKLIKKAFVPNPGDIITFTDADEIPHPSVYSRFNPAEEINALDMMFLSYYLNGRVYERWRYPKVMTGEYWRRAQNPHHVRFDTLRVTWKDWGMYRQLLPQGGWHFSWLGNAIKRRLKANSTSHVNDKDCAKFIRELLLTPTPGLGCKVKIVKIDKRWPKTVLANLEKYIAAGYIYP